MTIIMPVHRYYQTIPILFWLYSGPLLRRLSGIYYEDVVLLTVVGRRYYYYWPQTYHSIIRGNQTDVVLQTDIILWRTIIILLRTNTIIEVFSQTIPRTAEPLHDYPRTPDHIILEGYYCWW